MGSESGNEWKLLRSMAVGFLLSGLILAAICLPTSMITAILAGRDPLVSVLLLRSGNDLSSFFARPHFFDASLAEVSTVSAALGFYGSLTATLPLIYMIVRRDGLIKFLTLTNGMYLGLTIAYVWFRWTHIDRIDWFAPTAMEIGYIYMAFLVAEAAKLIVEDWKLSALPYLYAIDGLFGTVAVLIIHVGYDPSFASLLLGPFFLVAVAVAILLSEWILLRPATILFTGLGLAVTDSTFERGLRKSAPSRWPRFGLVVAHLRSKIGEAAGLSYRRRAKLIETTVAKAMRGIPRPRGRRARRLDWRLVAAICLFNTLFPLLVMAVARLVF
jgi:hypothetical protein